MLHFVEQERHYNCARPGKIGPEYHWLGKVRVIPAISRMPPKAEDPQSNNAYV